MSARSPSALLDTHFLIWILRGSDRLAEYPWLGRYRPWALSPVSLLELQFLVDVGRLDGDVPALTEALLSDPRFMIDEPPLVLLIRHALPLSWTRDPFDRLLAAHSGARRLPLCTADRTIRAHHASLVPEMSE